LEALFKTLPAALAWSKKSFGNLLPLPLPSPASAAPQQKQEQLPEKFVVFTGVRDKVLEGVLGARGWGIEPAVTKKTSVLVIADGDDVKESGKVKKAQAAGIRIMRISEFRTFSASR
jgi:NAD-dependent DNA ligase